MVYLIKDERLKKKTEIWEKQKEINQYDKDDRDTKLKKLELDWLRKISKYDCWFKSLRY